MTMTSEDQEMLERVSKKYLQTCPTTDQPPSSSSSGLFSRLGRRITTGITAKIKRHCREFASNHPKTIGVGLAAIIASTIGIYTMYFDFITKRQAYPIRDVLFHCQEKVEFTLGDRKEASKHSDRNSESIISRNEEGGRIGEILGISKFDVVSKGVTDELHYQLENPSKTRIAFAQERSEPVQSGLSVRGNINFKELDAELVGRPERYIRYSFIPERGTLDIQVNMLVDAKKHRRLINEQITTREGILGFFFGDHYRASTQLVEFSRTPANEKRFKKFLSALDAYNYTKDTTPGQREAYIDAMINLLSRADIMPIYTSHEDGLFKIFPTESSTYLFSDPSSIHRFSRFFGANTFESPFESQDPSRKTTTGNPSAGKILVGKKISHHQSPSLREALAHPSLSTISNPNKEYPRIRVENEWDFFPGWIPFLEGFTVGKEPNTIKPFAHHNNGGYRIEDSRGVIAKVEIVDFLLHYGDSVLYHYYLDKNGDGVIDEKTECIGKVLFRTTQHDHSADPDASAEQAKGGRRSIAQRRLYTFMAGSNPKTGLDDFYLCNTIESFMANEVNRGFGQHSNLGDINNQRSSILLLLEPNLYNLGRALTVESSIVAAHDIRQLLFASHRDYIERYIVEAKQP